MPRSIKRPKNATRLDRFVELERYVHAAVQRKLGLLIIVGPPGLQKSSVVRREVGMEACWIEGHATPLGIYRELFFHRDQVVVIDDVDALYRDRGAVRLLKCLCQTELRKTVSWNSDAKALAHDCIPRSFTTSSTVILIANEWQTLNDNIAALEDRGHVIVFEPPSLEVHARAAQWFWDQEIFDFIARHLHLISQPSMRHYRLAWEKKEAGLDWQRDLLDRWGVSRELLLLVDLLADPSYSTEKARVAAFATKTGLSPATYYNYKQKLQAGIAAPAIKLTNKSPEVAAAAGLFDLLRDRYGKLGNG